MTKRIDLTLKSIDEGIQKLRALQYEIEKTLASLPDGPYEAGQIGAVQKAMPEAWVVYTPNDGQYWKFNNEDEASRYYAEVRSYDEPAMMEPPASYEYEWELPDGYDIVKEREFYKHEPFWIED
jgi:hypothetical protein